MSTFAPLKQRPVPENHFAPARKVAAAPKRKRTIANQSVEDSRISATRFNLPREGSHASQPSRPVMSLLVLQKVTEAEHAPIQTKLEVSEPGDELEQEADRVAEQVMRMPDTAVSNGAPGSVHSTGPEQPLPSDPEPLQREQDIGHESREETIQRVCASCAPSSVEDEDKTVQRKADGSSGLRSGASVRNMSLHDGPLVTERFRRNLAAARNEGGAALPQASRQFMEPRFGANFGNVRVHANAQASFLASAVNARAFTVGRDLFFKQGEFQPESNAGLRLLAHELAHVVQQAHLGELSVRRSPCRSATACVKPVAGDPGRFTEKVVAQQAAQQAAITGAPSGSPAAALLARHKNPATHLKSLIASAGATLPSEVHGIFINAFLGETVSAQVTKCSAFPNGAPAGAPATKSCIQVPAATEDEATALLAKPSPRSPADTVRIGDLVSTVVHEAQHAQFDTTAASVVPAAADCNLGTVVFHGPVYQYNVQFYLSEMSAIISEFAPIFQEAKSSPSGPTKVALLNEERQAALNKDESLKGIIQTLRCSCSCSTVDTFTEQVFNNATSSWSAPQKDEFKKAMTRIMPSVWPKRLHRS